MNYVAGAVCVPHNPKLTDWKSCKDKELKKAAAAYRKAAEFVSRLDVQTIVIVTSQADYYHDYIQISSDEDRNLFRPLQPDPGEYDYLFDVRDFYDCCDNELIGQIEDLLDASQIPAGTSGDQTQGLDCGTIVPLHFLSERLQKIRYVRVCAGGPDCLSHYQLGQIIARAANKIHRQVAVVACGNLSERLDPGSGSGYSLEAVEYEANMITALEKGDFRKLLETSEKQIHDYQSTGHKPLCVLAGMLDGLKPNCWSLDHYCSEGCGMAFVTWMKMNPSGRCRYAKSADSLLHERKLSRLSKKDDFCRLAIQAIEEFVCHRERMDPPQEDAGELIETQAGAFVTISTDGTIRGSSGSLLPSQKNLGCEIIASSIHACMDARYVPLEPWELEEVQVCVYVVSEPEIIESWDEEMDAHCGLAVHTELKTSVFLPDEPESGRECLTFEQKLNQAGAHPGSLYILQRFEVEKHA